MPPSTRALLPAIPAELDKDPELLAPLSDGEMGTIVIDSSDLTRKYGVLGVRYNTLREFYGCVREAANTQKEVKDCL